MEKLTSRIVTVATTVAIAVAVAGAGASVTSGAYRDDVVADSPVSYWRLGESSGLTAVDDRGVNPGTYANGVSLGAPGSVWNDADRAASFDGIDDQVSVPHSTSLNATTGVTVEVWLKRTKSGVFQPLVGKPLNGQSRFENYSIWLNSSSRPVAYFGNGTTFVSVTGTAPLDTNWHHLVATYDNGTARLFVDGSLNASATSTVQLTPNVDRLYIARTSSGGFAFGGALDEVAVYTGVLSATRIRSHYDAARTDSVAPTVTLTQPPNGNISSNTVPNFSGSAGVLGGDSATVTVKVYPGSSPSGTPVQTLSTTRQAGGGYSVAASPALADGTYTARSEQRDDAGNTGLSSANTFSVDTTGPTVAIDSTPPNPSSSTSAIFTFTANESVSGFQCRLDGGSFSTCVSPKSYSGLGDGAHAFDVRATDLAGNTGAATSYAWTVDRTAPTTTITASPPNPSANATASFSFSANEAGSGFECSIDDGAFAACTSPRTYSGLADGAHTFDVRATDLAGNTGAPASYDWTVDTTAPTTTITSRPPNPSASASASASFSFSASEGGASFQCRLDGAAFAACTSPTGYSGLADGPHSFEVKATDAAGNAGTAASYGWTIDTGAPTTTITSRPPDPSNNASASFSFSASEPGASFQCRLDGAAFAACTSPTGYSGLADGAHSFEVKATDTSGNTGPPTSYGWTIDTAAPTTTITSRPPDPSNSTSASFSFTSEPGASFQCRLDGGAFGACTSPKSYSGLLEGAHSFEVKATDAAGNAGPAASYGWTIDTTPPAVTLATPPHGSTTNDQTPSFSGAAGSATGDAVTVTVKVWAGPSTEGTPVQELTATRSGGSYSIDASAPLDPGTYTARSEQADAAGNTGLSSANTFSVDTGAPDTEPPTVLLDSPQSGSSTSDTTPAFSGIAGTHAGDLPSVTVKIYSGSSVFGPPLQILTAVVQPNGSYSVDALSPLAEGLYTAQAEQSDAAGNTGFSSPNTFTVDTTAPTTTITANPPNPSASTSASFSFSASEGGASFQCRLDGAAFAACTSPTSYAGLGDGAHSFEVKATDAAGNTGAPATYGWTIDTGGPTTTITANPPNPSASASASFSFSASEGGASFQCRLDGAAFAACTSPTSYSGLGDGAHSFEVKATDAAGNTGAPATYGWTIDTAAPTTTITSRPPDPSNSASPSFSFSASEGGASFQCRLDGAAFAACTSPKSYSGLADGAHSFEVKATDAAGNTGAPATYGWTIDTAAPTTTITANPPDPSNSTSASFSFSSEPGAGFQCRLDGAAFVACTSPKSYSGLLEGAHSFEVKATDAAGNTGAPATYGWTIDRTAPTTTITARPSDPSNSAAPSFSFSANEIGATFECALDGSAFASCTSPKSYSGLGDSGHTFEVRATDQAGNTGAGASYGWTIDTVAPALSLTAPAGGSSTAAPKPTFSGTAGTALRDLSTVTVKIYSGPLPTGTLVQTLTATAGAGGSYSVRAVSPLPAGSYTARSQQDDQAGNTGLSSANTFSVTDPIIVAGGDIAACEEGSGEQATAAILDEYPDATVAVLGDTAYPNGTASEFANCYDPSWGRARSRTLPAIGDHEYGTPNASGYFAYFNEQLAPFGAAATDSTRGWYSYDLGVWHVVVLNSNCAIVGGCAVGSPMEQWLRADLAAHPAPCTLAYWHHPRFSSGGEHGNNTDVQPLFQALHDSGVDVVLNGNDHIYERYAPQTATGTLDVDGGVREFVVGTGGAFLYPIGVVNPNSEVRNNVDYGTLKLTLHPTSYDWQFLAEAGGTFTDAGTTQCHGRQAPPPPPPGAPSVRAVSSNVANRSTTLTIDRPAGTLEGDVLLAIVGHQNGQSRNMSAPTGWTAVPNTDRADQNNVRIHGWYKVAGPAEPATYTFTLTGGSGQDSSGGILAISGARASAPIDASGGQVNGTASKSVVAPSVTTTSPATLLVFGGACNWPVTYIPPPGMLERWDRASGSASSRLATEAATEAFAGPAATGTKTATATASCRSVGILIAVAPA